MAHFYGGYKIEYLRDLCPEDFSMLIKGMEIMSSREILKGFTVQSFTKMKSRDRSRLHHKVYKEAYPNEIKERAATVKDLDKVFGSFGSIESVMKEKI